MSSILQGDARDLIADIADNSVDLIFTDPPYDRASIPLYAWLSEASARVLKPGGFLLTYVGNMHKYDTMLALGQHLTYFWDYLEIHAGMGTMVWPKNTVARHKSIMAFVKGEGKPRCRTLGSWVGTGKEKSYHQWGQSASTARYYIDCFTLPGHLVLDPFCGGGTVPYVCAQIARECIAFEIDPHAVYIAQARLEQVQMPLPEFAPDLQQSMLGDMAGSEDVA